jgi:hypothetical protein
VGTPEELRCDLRGFTIPFDQDLLASLYPDRATYERRAAAAIADARRAGFVLDADVPLLENDVAAAPVS